jgi:hypothetical protein
LVGFVYILFITDLDESSKILIKIGIIFLFTFGIIEFVRIPHTIYLNDEYIVFKSVYEIKILLIIELKKVGFGLFSSPLYIIFSTDYERIKIANHLQSKIKFLNCIKKINPSIQISKRLY